MSDFQRGQEYMRQRIADLFPEHAHIIMKLPLHGDLLDIVKEVLEPAMGNTAELRKETLEAENVGPEIMNMVLR
jgi:hypothetical protein